MVRMTSGCGLDQSVANIFEYPNILVTNIISDIRSYQVFFDKYSQTFICVKFVCTDIFGHLFVGVLECKNKTNIQIYSDIHTIFNANIYSDIRGCGLFLLFNFSSFCLFNFLKEISSQNNHS